MLELRHVRKTYPGPQGPVIALADFCLEIRAGDSVAVRGASGSGKTTLLLIAGGLLQPDAGQALFEGRDLYQMATAERDRLRATAIGFVFQQFHLVPYLSVLENILTPTVAQGSS